MGTMIRAQGLNLKLSGRHVLRDLNFAVEEGSFVAVIGPNGAGKSSLLKCLMGIHSHWSGHVQIANQDFAEMTQRQLAQVIAYVPQDVPDPPAYTVSELIKMCRYAHQDRWGRKRDKDSVVTRVLAQLELTRFADRPLVELSGGERRRVYIAAALAQEPRILLLDEPLTFLDPKQRWEVMRLLNQIHAQAMTIFIVTHGLDENLPAEAQVLGLRGGQLLYEGSRSTLLHNGVLKALFDMDHRAVVHPYSGTQIPVFGGTP